MVKIKIEMNISTVPVPYLITSFRELELSMY